MSITKNHMIRIPKTLMALLLTTTIAIPGLSATNVFQEGSDGYSGTTDSYIGSASGYSGFVRQKFGTAPTMLLGCEQYRGG
jgi:hypothetical protein